MKKEDIEFEKLIKLSLDEKTKNTITNSFDEIKEKILPIKNNQNIKVSKIIFNLKLSFSNHFSILSKVSIISFFIISIFFITSINSKNNISVSRKNKNDLKVLKFNTEPGIKTIISSSDNIRNLGLKELSSESIVIVNGKTIDQSYFDMDGQTYTKSTIQIDKVYKGNVKKGTSIEIIEFGGITEENPVSEIEDKTGTKLSESEKAKYKKTKVKILVGGVPTSQKGEQNVFFLEKVPMSIIQKAKINQEAYTPLGSTQGRLTVKNNTFQRYSGDSLIDLKINEDELINELKK